MVVGVGRLDGNFEVVVAGRMVSVCFERVEDRIVGTVDALMKTEAVAGTGQVVERTLIVALVDRMMCGSGQGKTLLDREDETGQAAATVGVGIETALDH